MADTMALSTCVLCGEQVMLVDEHDRCEVCVIDAEQLAEVLTDIEQIVAGLLRDQRITVDQLRSVFELILSDGAGTVAGVAREPVATSERGVWSLSPPSVFDEPAASCGNRIGRLRRTAGMTFASVAELIGARPEEVALWEQGVMPSDEQVRALAALFGVSPAHVLGGSVLDDDDDWEEE